MKSLIKKLFIKKKKSKEREDFSVCALENIPSSFPDGNSTSEASYYLLIDQERKGPFTKEAIRKMIRLESISLHTLYWKEGMKEWEEVSHLNILRLKSHHQ